jgi:beta-glucosidase
MTSAKNLFCAALIAIASVGCGDDADPQLPGQDASQPDATPDPAPDAGQPDAGGPDAGPVVVEWPEVTSRIGKDPAIEAAVTDLLAQMSLAQKVGQMVQAEIQSITPAQAREYHIGSVLNGGGSWPGGGENKDATAAEWVALADAYYDASTDTSGEPGAHLGIPIIWGTDAVHGHSNVMGATLFPHNIGLGAANDPDLLQEIARITATEVAVTGIDWTFAPTLAVVRDDRWGRAYEGYSEDPGIVHAYGGRIVQGLQGDPSVAEELFGAGRVIATAKHFLGDGGTNLGDDQGDNLSTEAELRDIHAQGYLSAIEAGAQAVMASFSSWQGQKMHGNHYLLTEILKGSFHFDGLIVGDWNGHGQVSGCDNTQCAAAINAGIDMIMVPADWQAFIANTIAQVESGEIPMARIDDAVTRILRVKMRLGLLGPKTTKGKPSTRPLAGQGSLLGAAEHRAVAREAVRKSLVLLKNKNDILPLDKNIEVLVAGKTAADIGNQSGGWTLSWQGTGNTNADFPNAQSIFAGIEEAVTAAGGTATLSADGSAAAAGFDAAIVVIGETPYAEGVGDISKFQTLEHAVLHPEDLEVIERVRTQAPGVPIVTVLVAGRPLHVNKELNRSDAFVMAWLPGSEGGGIADVLFGDHGFTGKLPFSWPGADCQTPLNHDEAGGGEALFGFGFGLTYEDADTLGDDLPEISTGRGCDAPDPGDPGTVDQPLELFTGGANQGDYVLRIGGPSNWSVDVVPGATLPQNEVTFEVVDGQVQGSAMRIDWHAQGQVYSQLRQATPGTNLAAYGNSESTLSFRVRVDGPIEANYAVMSIHCEWPCLGEVPLRATLASLTPGEWHELSVPIECFMDSDFDITNVNTPFLIWADGPMSLSIEDVRWVPFTADEAPSCSAFQ